MEEEYCPICDGVGEPIGNLGSLVWYRCRQCGMYFNVKEEQIVCAQTVAKEENF